MKNLEIIRGSSFGGGQSCVTKFTTELVDPSGDWTSKKESACPFGPKTGWLIIVIFLGLLGLLIFLHANKTRQKNCGSGRKLFSSFIAR